MFVDTLEFFHIFGLFISCATFGFVIYRLLYIYKGPGNKNKQIRKTFESRHIWSFSSIENEQKGHCAVCTRWITAPSDDHADNYEFENAGETAVTWSVCELCCARVCHLCLVSAHTSTVPTCSTPTTSSVSLLSQFTTGVSPSPSRANSLGCKLIDCVSFSHQWIRGYCADTDRACVVCDCFDTCPAHTASDAHSYGSCAVYGCCWCHCVWTHECCVTHTHEQICTYGRYKAHIIPPSCVQLGRNPFTNQSNIASLKLPDNVGENWQPVIVIGNSKSGSNESELVLSSFRKYLNPIQVIELGETRNARHALDWLRHLGTLTTLRCCCLVAGGDGTVDWVMDLFERISVPFAASVCVGVLPVGTGNDLSRVLGFGSKLDCSGDEAVARWMYHVAHARTTLLDRWMIQFHTIPRLTLATFTHRMNNYFSIGVDALVTLNFHRTRQSPFYLWSNRLLNKLIYFCYGTKDVLARECVGLNSRLTLYLDDRMIELPQVEAIVVQNIASWGGGVYPWTLGAEDIPRAEQRMDDGLLEVFALYSSFHIAQLQMSLSEPYRVGQARSVKIVTYADAPIQVDGEPWQQTPCTIEINHHKRVSVMSVL